MNKRKILVMAMALAMCAILVVGGTLAYFTDTDSAKNVMTTGNVKIEQIEQQRDENGELEEFEDDKKLYPITKPFNYDEYVTIVPDQKDRGLADNDYNVVDKIVTVKNVGTEEAYARTIFAYEMLKVVDEKGNVEWKNPLWKMDGPLVVSAILDIYGNGMQSVNDAEGNWLTFELDGIKYVVCEYYHGALAPQETSVPSLLQIYLKADVDNEFYDYVGEEYNILTLSQATQTAGFNDCREALEQAFGKVAEADLVEWFKDVE